jgi:predicted phosphodiesterase
MMRKFTFFLVSAVFVAIALAPVSTAQALVIIKGPYLQQLTQDSIVIMWETDTEGGSRVDYGLTAPDEYFAEGPTGVTIHEIQLTGLTPDTMYYYTVTSDGVTSADSTFATAPAAERSFCFVVYGDTRTYPSDHAAVIQGIINSVPEFVLHTGDLVTNGRSYDEWGPQFFNPTHDLMIKIPLLPVLGNHEYNGSGQLWFLDFFSLPNNKEWFAFTYGNVRFIGLNTMADYSPVSIQYNWLKAELQSPEYSSATWHIVYFHHPPYTASTSHSDEIDVQIHLVPLFEQYGVDMVFNGHTHAYERYFHNGIYYIVTGGGGGPLHGLVEDTQPPIREFGESTYHHCAIYVNVPDRSLTLSARYNNGTEFDTVTLYKGPVPNTPSNLTATAVSRSQIDLSWVDNSTDENGFKIERSPDGISFTLLTTVGPNVTTYSDTNLPSSTRYYYSVYAYNANGDSDYAVPWAKTFGNRPPVADDQLVTTSEDTQVDITLTGSDPDGDPLTYILVTDPCHGSLTGTVPNLTYTPDPNFNGLDSFTFMANDGILDSELATVSITVTPVADPPVADNQSVTTKQNTVVDITLTASDPDGDALTYEVVTAPANGTLSGTAPNLTYTPSPGYVGPDSFTFKANDGMTDSNIAIISITVTVNNPPVADSQLVETAEDTSVAITLTGSDPDGDPLTYILVTDPCHGSLSGTAPNLTYTPNSNFNGSDSFTFKVNDGELDSDTATVSITVTPVNDPPVANDDTATTYEDTSVLVEVLTNDTDFDDDTLTVESVTQGSNGTVVNNAGNTVTYNPNTNFYGTDAFTYTVSDGKGGSDTATVNVTINAVNDDPVANDDSATTPQDTPVTIDVLANDTDPDTNDTLTVDLATQPSNGAINVNPDSTVTYTPNAGFYGTDAFTYTVSDGQGGSDTATVNITVAPSAPQVITSADFESGFGEWVNVTGDTHDWTRDSGGTPSSSTGPSTGANGSTWYVYLETSSGGANSSGNTAYLQGPDIGGSNRTLTFYYHMYGADMGSLNVDVYSGGSWHNAVWSISGQQHTSNGAAYTQATVDLSSYTGTIKIRFRAVAAGGYRGDMAIDDIEVTGVGAPPPPGVLTDADFESGFGEWVNVTGDTHDWTRDSGGTPSSSTGPSTGANGSTWYVYLETSSGGANSSGNTAYLQGPDIGGSNRTLTFYYHMYGADMGSLNVDVYSGGSWHNAVWSISGQQHTSNGAAYTQATVDLSSYTGTIKIRFRAVAAGGYRGDMAIDDIEVTGVMQ